MMPRLFRKRLLAELNAEQTMALYVVRAAARRRRPPAAVQKIATRISARFAGEGEGERLSWLLRIAMCQIAPKSAAEIAALKALLDQVIIATAQGRLFDLSVR
jgi:hypothetical protein